MKPEVEAAFGELVAAQAKAERAKERLTKAEAERDQAMATHTEAVNYVSRLVHRLQELTKAEGREVNRLQVEQQRQQQPPKPTPVVIPPQQRQKR